MAITPVTLPGVYDMIVEYANIASPTQTWRNTWTYRSASTPAFGDAFQVALGSLATNLCHSDAQIVKFSVYNWARGRQPYPTGEPVYTHTVTQVGDADAAWGTSGYTPTGGEVVVRVDHQPATGGKPGRSFIRALLGEGDVQSTSGGRWSIKSDSHITDAQLQSLIITNGLDAFLHAGGDPANIVVVRYSPKTGVVHGSVDVTHLSLIGASTNKQTRKNKR